MSQSALVVCTNARRLSAYKRALAGVADVVFGATTFAQAKALLLEKRPEVLVAEVRLHEYNGIHLALWSRDRLPQLRSVIVGESDSVLHKDANAAGAAYLHQGDMGAIVEAVEEALAGRNRPRRWPRNRLAHNVPAQIGDQPARLVDVSYGGFCVEMAACVIEDPETGFTLDIPEFGVRTRARCIWTTQVATSGRFWCGAALADEESLASGWRELVDALLARRHRP